MIDPGDTIITENPTFLGALIAFNPYQPGYAVVPIDADGMIIEGLERTLEANPRAKMIYTVPDFQNPTGVTLSEPRRRRLIELANHYGLLVLEDTPYRELRYDGDQLPTLRSLDTEGRVVHLGSFSKILAPGLRLGWAVAGADILDRLGLLKLAADTQSSTLNMAATSAYLTRFDIDAHIARACAVYRRRRDLLLATMAAAFPAEVAYTRPHGGLFSWLTFPPGFDAATFMKEEMLPKAQVAYVPGATFFPLIEETNHARLSFSGVADERLVRGITRLGQLLEENFNRGGVVRPGSRGPASSPSAAAVRSPTAPPTVPTPARTGSGAGAGSAQRSTRR
jgi:DNA-binding transcriptional MocR family regulator